jgi:enoyl-CoA hydratase/carnithine racemase
MNYETILYSEASDGVATITINRPHRLNAFTRQMGEEFVHVWKHIRENPDVRAVVLRAEGRAFCTGSDGKESGWRLAGKYLGPFEQDDPGPSLGPKQNHLWKPVICAVNGMACGGAFYWLNEADIIICSENAEFFDPHVSVGKVCAVEPIGLMGRVNIGHIQRMILMGLDERICAATAMQIGLVTEVTPNDELHARAHELAVLLAMKPPTAMQGTVRAIWEAQDMPRSVAVANGLKFAQLGNAIGAAELASKPLPKRPYRVR